MMRARNSVGAAFALLVSSVTVVAVGAVTTPANAVPTIADPDCTAVGDLVTCTFAFTGELEESWVVPEQIASSNLGFELRGGSGGRGILSTGGLGGFVSGTVDVQPGDELLLTIGGHGGDSWAYPRVGDAPQPNEFGKGGFPNGGYGGGSLPFGYRYDAGGGGGATFLLIERSATPAATLAVAGGGGGGGGGAASFVDNRAGGDGGNADAAGADGLTAGHGLKGEGGTAGTQTAGGDGGLPGYCEDPPLGTGSPGGDGSGPAGPTFGGNGGKGYDGLAYTGLVLTGGGGGGGYRGGGGGGAGGYCEPPSDRGTGGGGGGGSSIYDPAQVSNGQIALDGTRGDGEVRITFKAFDETDPDTTIDSGPTDPTSDVDATFAFSGTDPGSGDATTGIAGFECSLDGAAFAGCTSPVSSPDLADGEHTFRVRAVDGVGHRDATPATHTWTVDTTGALGSCEAAGDDTVCTFAQSDRVAYQTWTVPDGVHRATFRVDGARGGSLASSVIGGEPADGATVLTAGGRGGRAEGSVAVTPGEVLRLYVGEKGPDQDYVTDDDCRAGGPDGGPGGCTYSTSNGAGGGGSSDVRRAPYTLGDRLVVGAGGGGAAFFADGGDGGGSQGLPGGKYSELQATVATGGTQEAGGAAGTFEFAHCSTFDDFVEAEPGAFGSGGHGGECAFGDGGGGGGGGYYGGGGGEAGGSGGGGSSFVVATARDATLTAGANDQPDGRIRITYRVGEPEPDVTIGDVTTPEGDAGVTDATLTVTLSGPSSSPVSVAYATASGTASAGVDYTETSGVLEFSPGETTRTIHVPVKGDDVWEPEETVTVELSDVQGATLGDDRATLTIDNDDAVPTYAVSSPSVLEGDTGTTDLDFTVSLSRAASIDLDLDVTLAPGTATAGSDYDALTVDRVTIPAGSTSATVTVKARGDTTIEPDETLVLTVVAPTGSPLVRATASGTGTVLTDDTYAFGGFQSPIDPMPVVNKLKAGQSVPVKFSLGGAYGLDVFSTAPAVRQVACDSHADLAVVETTVTANQGLTFDATTGTYTYVWKTAANLKGSCRQLVVSFRDGSTYRAEFSFK